MSGFVLHQQAYTGLEEIWEYIAAPRRTHSRARAPAPHSSLHTKGKGQSDFSDWPLFNAGQ
jgi:hypothetical protein